MIIKLNNLYKVIQTIIFMKKNIKILFLTILLLLISGCNSINQETEITNSNPIIITTFFPTEEITRQITQNTTNVELIIPYGAEPHSYEPTPKQIVKLSTADTLIIIGGIFEHIEQDLINSNKNLKLIQSTTNITNIESQEGHEENEENHENEQIDPHTWLSIKNMMTMTKQIETELITLYPEHKELYKQNSKNYLNKLKELENKYQRELSNCENNIILVNHKSFGHIASEYNFTQISVTGYSPESEPSPKTIQKVIETAKQYNLKYIFSEGQLDKKTVNVIAKEFGGEILELNPIKTNKNQTYITIMEENLQNLKTGLQCK